MYLEDLLKFFFFFLIFGIVSKKATCEIFQHSMFSLEYYAKKA